MDCGYVVNSSRNNNIQRILLFFNAQNATLSTGLNRSITGALNFARDFVDMFSRALYEELIEELENRG
jgi:hypothetical protein